MQFLLSNNPNLVPQDELSDVVLTWTMGRSRGYLWQLCATMMSWVGCLLKDSEHFILLAENSQILLKISVIPILLTFIYLVALNLLVNKVSTHRLTQLIVAAHNCHNLPLLVEIGLTELPNSEPTLPIQKRHNCIKYQLCEFLSAIQVMYGSKFSDKKKR